MIFRLSGTIFIRAIACILIIFCVVQGINQYQAYHDVMHELSRSPEKTSADSQELFYKSNTIRQHLILFIILLLGIIIAGSVLYLTFMPFDPRYLWHVSLAATGSLLAAIVLIWYVVAHHSFYEEKTFQLNNDQDVMRMLTQHNHHTNSSDLPTNNTQFDAHLAKNAIKTGIFLQNVDLISEQKIEINGYVWQHYYDGIHDSITRGFLLPHATRSTVTKINTVHEGNKTTIIWEIKAILYQNFSYERYPFDAKEVEIALWHPDFAQNVILVPDFNSYQTMNPANLPGLSSRASSHGWHILQSHFGYKKHQHNTNFGINSTSSVDKDSPQTEFFYELLIKRNLLPIFIMSLIPLLVILLLLFIIFLSNYLQLEHIFWQISGIFFSAAVVQSQLITKIPSSNPIYFESFYLLVYAIIVVLIILMTLNLLNVNMRLLKEDNLLVSKILYWPTVLASFFTITVYYLY